MKRVALLILILLATACGNRDARVNATASPAPTTALVIPSAAPTPEATRVPASPITNAPTLAPVKPLVLDCIPGSSCRALKIQGDAHYTLPNGKPSPFAGYADPSLRQDPLNKTLWLGYSYPNYHFDAGKQTPGVDIHLAKSGDGGNSWTLVKNLFPSTPLPNPARPNENGYLDHEVINLLPVVENNRVTWYAARLDYFVPNVGGYAARANNSFHLRVFKADSPEALNDAPFALLSSNLTATEWGAHQNLQTLNPELSDVGFWNEPALAFEDGRLYLATVAFVYDRSGNPVMNRNNVYVFSTEPTGAPNTWRWIFNGTLARARDANELGAQRLTQIDLARGADGKWLLIATPDDWHTTLRDYNHKGCQALEIQSLKNPALARGADGKLRVRAIITASDSNELGSAACTYDPGSASGIVLTRRVKTANELTVSLWQTGIKP
jgi:hypothetical protein